MHFEPLALPGVFLIRPHPAADERGLFARTWCQRTFREYGLAGDLVQCSVSFNRRAGTLRGLHYQSAPHAEAKLVRCTRGRLYDVAVDLRPDSPTFRRWVAVELTGDEGPSIESGELAARIAASPAEDVAAELARTGVRAAVVRSAGELVSDGHLAARGFFPEITHPDPDLGTARLVGLPWRFAGEVPVPLSPPPGLGATSADALYERTTV